MVSSENPAGQNLTQSTNPGRSIVKFLEIIFKVN